MCVCVCLDLFCEELWGELRSHLKCLGVSCTGVVRGVNIASA